MNETKHYVIKTKIGSEPKVIEDMKARLMDFGSLKEIQNTIHNIYHKEHMRGYIVLEADNLFVVEQLIGKNANIMNTTHIKGIKTIIGELAYEDAQQYIQDKSPFEGIDIGCIVEITKGAFKGEQAVVVSMSEKKEEIKVQLRDGLIPLDINLNPKHIRIFSNPYKGG
ncbi:transcription elongation factor Spt5 [archaeon]|nr:transcription elongation factor Spt5 [archaeon]|tara:strand:+ start:410 stop:913 length:504 start_codon:yes stop_codon:yes gene_type:complete